MLTVQSYCRPAHVNDHASSASRFDSRPFANSNGAWKAELSMLRTRAERSPRRLVQRRGIAVPGVEPDRAVAQEDGRYRVSASFRWLAATA